MNVLHKAARVHSSLFILTISSVMLPRHQPHLPHDHTCESKEVLVQFIINTD